MTLLTRVSPVTCGLCCQPLYHNSYINCFNLFKYTCSDINITVQDANIGLAENEINTK